MKAKKTKKYRIHMSRIGLGSTEYSVMATSKKEAIKKAYYEAGDHDYNEYGSDYKVVKCALEKEGEL